MDIVNYLNIAHSQNGGLWWKIDIKTNEHFCSELLSKICGIKQNLFTMENFRLMLHSDYRNKLLRQISTFLKISASGERLSFLTKSVYHWTRNIPVLLDDNSSESQITSGLTDFTTDHNVCATQNTKDQTKADRQAMILVFEDIDSDFILITSIFKHQHKLTRALNGCPSRRVIQNGIRR